MQQISEQELDRRARQSAADRILRDAEVRDRTGLSRTTRWRLIKKKKFPEPVCITEHAIGWKESEIQSWIEARQPKQVAAGGRHMARPASRKSTPVTTELIKLAVCDGGRCLGYIHERGRERTALDRTGKHLGVFATRKAAADAVAEAAGKGDPA